MKVTGFITSTFWPEMVNTLVSALYFSLWMGACWRSPSSSATMKMCIRDRDGEAARRFLAAVDSAAVYWNASTRFTDGGEFGLGCEMGISTQKLHARGPLGLAELCSFKFVIRGGGQIR